MTDARAARSAARTTGAPAFLPAAYQGTMFRSTGDPIVDLKPPAASRATISARASTRSRS